jgi:sialate O-acetylesterase
MLCGIRKPAPTLAPDRWKEPEMRPLSPTGIVLAVAASLAPAASADVKLPAVIGSHMVLQQQADVAIWGTAGKGETVTVAASWGKDAFTGKADSDGRFRVMVRTPDAGGPYTLSVSAGKSQVTLEDVLIGEVWLCGGQSNMEWSFSNGGVLDLEKERAAAADPQIRLFDAPDRLSPRPEDDCGGSWAACDPKTVNTFSCVGYFFARELRKALKVPVGLIGVNWGGTVAEAWVSEEGLQNFPQFKPQIARLHAEAAAPDSATARMTRAAATWWAALDEQDLGKRNGWAVAGFDDSGWEDALVPSMWSGDLAAFDGIAWYRRAFELPPALVGQDLTLSLGPIDDMDQTFLDGRKIGGVEVHGHWTDPRAYAIPASLATAGRHVLSVRVVDTGGGGGFGGKSDAIRLSRRDGSEPIPLAGLWKMRIGLDARAFPPLPEAAMPLHPNLPTVLWNGLVQPVVPFGIRGALWYQGESNRGRAAEYNDLMPALIADWRRHFGQGDFPFYFVQIAPYQYDGTRVATAELRQAQLQTLRVANTGMVVTMDIGDPGNIHPGNKQEVGRRLSLWALAQAYRRPNLECSGPLFSSMKVEGGKIRISFQHATGLNAKGGAPALFEVAGVDGRFVPAAAQIEGETVVVGSPQVPAPAQARFGFTDAGAVNLFNAAGLPASPFCRIAPPETGSR